MNILIRSAQPDDCETIAEIIKESMGYDNSPALIKSNLERILPEPTDKILVAEIEGHIVGFIHAENYDCLYAPHLKDLMSFAVRPQFQHKQIGTKLLNEIEKWAVETGRSGVRIISGIQRKDAHRFYISRGYTPDKEQLNLKKTF